MLPSGRHAYYRLYFIYGNLEARSEGQHADKLAEPRTPPQVPEIKHVYHHMPNATDAAAQETIRKVLHVLAQTYTDEVVLTLFEMDEQSQSVQYGCDGSPLDCKASVDHAQLELTYECLDKLNANAPEGRRRYLLCRWLFRTTALLQLSDRKGNRDLVGFLREGREIPHGSAPSKPGLVETRQEPASGTHVGDAGRESSPTGDPRSSHLESEAGLCVNLVPGAGW
ncbi:hypothetical protein R6Z07M_011884 [Ovis aries]